MKKLLFTVSLMALAIFVFAQPSTFKYQTVVRDASGEVLSTQSVSFQISLLQGSASGTNVYTETHSTTTNQFGLVTLEIGNGTVVSGDFGTIDWGSNDFFLQIELDENGGGNYQLLGTSQLLAVPYALYSEASGDDVWEKSGDDIYYENGKIGIGTSSPHPSSILEINSSTGGLLIPRMTQEEIMSITNLANGLTVYNKDDCSYYVYRGCSSKWTEIEFGAEMIPIGNYSIGTGDSCLNTISNGNYKELVSLNVSNTVNIEATVTTLGSWSIITDTINGYSFSGNGTFSLTGLIQITLYGNGIPLSDQTDIFVATASDNCGTCTFSVTVSPNGSGLTYETAGFNCMSIQSEDPNLPDGIYWIDPDGSNGNDPYQCYCDMTIDGGGWTLVASMADDGNDYWTWNNQTFLFNGNVYGSVTNFTTNDYQNDAWATVLGDEIMFMKGNELGKYLIYDDMINSQTLSSKFTSVNNTVYGDDNPIISGEWWQQCGQSFEFRLQSPDSDPDGWGEASKGFIWRSDNNDGCNWDDTGGGINNSKYSDTEHNWEQDLFYYQNFSGSALMIFIR